MPGEAEWWSAGGGPPIPKGRDLCELVAGLAKCGVEMADFTQQDLLQELTDSGFHEAEVSPYVRERLTE